MTQEARPCQARPAPATPPPDKVVVLCKCTSPRQSRRASLFQSEPPKVVRDRQFLTLLTWKGETTLKSQKSQSPSNNPSLYRLYIILYLYEYPYTAATFRLSVFLILRFSVHFSAFLYVLHSFPFCPSLSLPPVSAYSSPVTKRTSWSTCLSCG